MEQPDREEMRALAAKLATQIPDKDIRAQASLIAEGKVPRDSVRYHFNRICRWVSKSKSSRIDKKSRTAVLEWLAEYGGPLRKDEALGAKRLEMRLTIQQYDEIKRAADKAGLTMADYARRATLLNTERTLGGK